MIKIKNTIASLDEKTWYKKIIDLKKISTKTLSPQFKKHTLIKTLNIWINATLWIKCYHLNKGSRIVEKKNINNVLLYSAIQTPGAIKDTGWKVSNYGVISGPYFPLFGPNTGKYGPEITPYLDTILAVIALQFEQKHVRDKGFLYNCIQKRTYNRKYKTVNSLLPAMTNYALQ